MGPDLVQIGLQVQHLRFQLFAMLRQHRQELLELGRGVARAVVGVDDFLGLDQGQPQPLGTKGELDRKSTRLNSSHIQKSRMPSSA